MKRSFFDIYQYIALIILFPVAYYLWKNSLNSNKLTIIILGLPIIISYIIPFVGTNITKFWEFNIKHKVKNIRLYHGFVFGSATSLIGYMFYLISSSYKGVFESVIFAFICGAFISFWNTIYDYNAVRCGFIKINNLAAKQGKTSLETVCDYAPSYFYTLGFIYALFIKFIEFVITVDKNISIILPVILFYLSALILPTVVHMCFHYIKYKSWGFWGCK